jgi:hypothetical protein
LWRKQLRSKPQGRGTHFYYLLELAKGGSDRRADERNLGQDVGLVGHDVEKVFGYLGKL